MELVFDEAGYLMPGEHPFNLDTFEREFVINPVFSNSNTRDQIFANFKNFLNEIVSNNLDSCLSKIWIDGSFCTNKMNPNDLDIIIFYDCAAINKKSLEHYIDLNKSRLKYSENIHIMTINDFSNCMDYTDNEVRMRTDIMLNNRIKRYFMFDSSNYEKGYVILNKINNGGE